MGYAESLGSYWRGRYKLAPGKYATVRDADGDAIRFRTKAAAKKAADAEEAKLLAGTKKAPRERITFGAYVNRWYAAQDRRHPPCRTTGGTSKSTCSQHSRISPSPTS